MTNNYNDITAILDNMTDSEAKEYFESIETDYWIDEDKSNPCLT